MRRDSKYLEFFLIHRLTKDVDMNDVLIETYCKKLLD